MAKRPLDPLKEFKSRGKQRPQIKDVEDYLVTRLATQWRQLGEQLNIDQNSLDILQHNYPNDCEECCSRMLADWLDQNTHKNTTWEILIDAVHRLPTGIDREFQSTLTAANDYLQKCYINSRYLPTADEWPPYQPTHYTTLALIHHKDRCTDATVISVTQELVLAGKFDPKIEGIPSLKQTNVHSNTTKNISDIFVSVSASDKFTVNPSIILVEGAPGIGKTVLAKEIAFQWAHNNLLIDKKIVLLLFLRQCNFKYITSVEDLVKHVVRSSEMTTHLTKYLLQTEGKNLAIVFDGYDEISTEDRKNSIIADIIHRRLFAKCCLVVTSRPTASADLHSMVDCRVEIVGFTEEDRLDYIQTALQGDNNKVEELTHYLQSNPTINALCYIPLNMTILLCLVEDGIDKLPKTQTDMYKRFIEMTIIRFTQKIDINNSTLITEIVNLPYPHNKVFMELARIAYKALKVDKIVFTLNEIEKACPNLTQSSSNWSGLGLLKAVKYFNVEIGHDQVTFHFLHFSIQEFMAAYYISTLSNAKQVKLLKKTFWQHRYYNTWIMYVGITSGNSFSLKHFLSGNWFQVTTKIIKTSSISSKYLKHKIKSLHLFQCLVESNNEDMIALVSGSLLDNQIDLSEQTLLPSDVNTLGFFLLRSNNKQWEILNLSGCNIGSTGINILCDRFLDEKLNNRHMIAIKKVNFSFNHASISSLTRLFKLFKSWHVSEVNIIESDEIFNVDELYAIADSFDTNMQVNLSIGSFLLAHGVGILPILTYVTSIKKLYLLNCRWKLSAYEDGESLKCHHKFLKIHIIDSFYHEHNNMMTFLSLFIDNADAPYSIFIYNPTLPDQVLDSISAKMSCGVILVITSSKIQGLINTLDLRHQLSTLEILNLAVSLRAMYSNTIQEYSWRKDLWCNGSENDLAINTFIENLHKIATSSFAHHLRITLKHKSILITHNVNYDSLLESIQDLRPRFRPRLRPWITLEHESTSILPLIDDVYYEHERIQDGPPKTMYISNCNIISNTESEKLFGSSGLKRLYVYNSYLEIGFLKMLFTKLSCKEIFIHCLGSVDTYDMDLLISNRENCSTVFVTKHMLFGYKATAKQIAIAFQLEPSVDKLKLLNYHGTFDTFNQIIAVITVTSNNWSELNLIKCSIGVIECEILHKYLKTNECFSTVKVLKIPSEKLTMSILPKLLEMLFIWKVQELLLYGIECKYLIPRIADIFTTTFTLSKILLSVTYNRKKVCFFCNFDWDKIIDIPKVSTLYFINCQSDTVITNFIELDHIFQIYIINSSLCENDILKILETLVDRRIELSVYHSAMPINNEALYNFMTNREVFYQSNMSIVARMENFFCGFNITENQLHFLQHQQLCDLERDIMTLVSDTKQIHEKELIIFEDKELTGLHLVGIGVQASLTEFVAKLVPMLKGIRSSNLKLFGIENYNVTTEAANDISTILSHHKTLEQFYLNDIITSTTVILKQLVSKLTNLRIIEINNNVITDQATEYLASIITHNTKLTYISIANCSLQTKNGISISKALQSISNLQGLTIGRNNISTEAASEVAVAVSHNSQLQNLDLANNNLQTLGMRIIAKRLKALLILNVSNNYITKEAADDIAVTLSHCPQLKEFDVSNNDLQASGAITLAKGLHGITTLTKFCISNNNITQEAADDIAVTFSYCPQLKEFDVSNNDLQATGAIILAKGLQGITTLTKFCISNNNITQEAAGDIAFALSHNTQLQMLDISNNDLQAIGTIILAKGLCGITTMQKLFIGNNNITEEAANEVATLLCHNTQLKELGIGLNKLGSSGITQIAAALCKTKHLQVLKIEGNGITDDAVDSIAAVIASNTKLTKLSFGRNSFSVKGNVAIARTLQSNQNYRYSNK